jgi:putative flippase GtrA
MSVVVIDDGSPSDSQAIFDTVRKMATVLRHDVNRGKGVALRTGLTWVREHCPNDVVIVTADADGQHLPDDVTKVGLAVGDFDTLVLGARQDDANTPLRSRAGHALSRMLFRIAIGQRLTDTQTGLRAFRASLIPWLLQIPGDRYEYEMNMLVIAGQDKVALTEVPIKTVYIGKNETSHYRAFADSLRIARGMLLFAGASVISFLVDYALYTVLVILGNTIGVLYGVTIANVLARIGSATLNYNLNKRYVFRDARPAKHSALRYALLATGILLGNTLLLTWLTRIGGNAYLAKIAVEVLFFIVSYTLQRAIVFNRSKKPGGS